MTVETEVAGDVVAELFELYLMAFAHLEWSAAARHLLLEQEFREEVEDPRTLKYITWDDEGSPIALITVTSDLEVLPWISQSFYERRFPDQYARGAIHYLGVGVVHPDARSSGALREMLWHVGAAASEVGAIIATDMCEHNRKAGLHRLFDSICMEVLGAHLVEIDRQIYYGAVVPKGSLRSIGQPEESAESVPRTGL